MPIIDAMCIKMLANDIEPLDQVQVLSDYVNGDSQPISLTEVRTILMR